MTRLGISEGEISGFTSSDSLTLNEETCGKKDLFGDEFGIYGGKPG